VKRIEERLRLAREQKSWTLEALANRTGVRPRFLAAIEHGAFDELPTGLYGRAAIRAYAAAVGLDAGAVLDEVAHQLAPVEDPLDGLARVRGVQRRWRCERVQAAAVPVDQPDVQIRPCADARPARAAAAAAIDGALLSAINAAVWTLTSFALGVSPATAIVEAAPALCMLWTLIIAVYFILLGGIRNATVGSLFLGARVVPAEADPLTLRSSVVRGMQCAFEETSITVQWLIASQQGRQWLRTLRIV
jgi:transcriptional regulator with XRE-family HTH domain/uncharacterized RDD family membrane protein YckC